MYNCDKNNFLRRKQMKMLKNKRGITLIALVITIIVLLILAGITINLTIGEDGIISKAKEAGDKYAQAAENEQADLSNFLQETEALISSNTDTGSWNKTTKVNTPNLLTGMTPIKFNTPVVATSGQTDLDSIIVTTTSSDTNWYDYSKGEWANAQTEDGSMWVWIPRFAYIVNSSTQTFDIVFLIGKTDNYYKADGTIGTAQRATADNLYPDTTGTEYTVHPAFTDESSINYVNGGWDSELTGIWVAKFEAGLQDSNDTTQTITIGTIEDYYPVFKGQRYSYNYISGSNAFLLSQAIAKENNPYGLNSTSTDSHLMKNSEWGAVAYLSQSQYGLNGTNIVTNNVSYNATKTTMRGKKAYAVTGYAGTSADIGENTLTAESVLGDTVTGNKTSYAWYTGMGIKASSTGTIYGIYDLSGGLWERTASFVNNTYASNSSYGNILVTETNRKYVMAYASADSEITDFNNAETANYSVNSVIGDAISETSTAGTGYTSWYDDWSSFAGYNYPFFARSGRFGDGASAGLFAFSFDDDVDYSKGGFRAVLVAK
jgi:competence protein ComGC